MPSDSISLFDEQLASVVGLLPGGGLLAPSLERLSRTVRAETARRRSVALNAAEALAGCSREDLAEQIAADVRLVPLLTRVLYAAGTNGHDRTLEVLGASLGLALADTTRIDEAELVLNAVERLTKLELALLELVAVQVDRGKASFLISDLVEVAHPMPERLVRLGLSGLVASGLMEAASGYGALIYEQTQVGSAVLDVLHAYNTLL